MSHYDECPYSEPCPDEWRNEHTIAKEGLPVPHRIVSGSSGRCVECDAGDCICDLIRTVLENAAQRVRELARYGIRRIDDDMEARIIAAVLGSDPEAEREVTIHMCPPEGSGVMPCCGRTPFERMGDRMTLESSLVTCNGLESNEEG